MTILMTQLHKLTLILLLASLPAFPGFAQTDPALVRVLTGYTYKVESGIPGKRVYISCQRAVNAQGEVVGKGDINAQTRQVFNNLKVALQRVGASLADIQQISYRVKNLAQNQGLFDKAAGVYLPVEPQIKEFKDIQTLLVDDMLLEVEVIAVVN